MGDATKVLVGADGAVMFADAGATLPTGIDDVPDVAFTDLGFVSDAGLKESIGQSTQKIKNWKGDTVREVQTEHTLTYSFTLIETNDDAESAYYGTDPADGVTALQGTRGSWVFDIFDTGSEGDTMIRVVVPDGQVTARGDVLYKNDSAVEYELTITAYPDSDDNKAYRYRGVPTP